MICNTLYTVLNVMFPKTDIGEMLFYNLDILGIAASGGSACSSGSNMGHMLEVLIQICNALHYVFHLVSSIKKRR